MKLTPRFGDPRALEVAPDVMVDPATPNVRQRQRFIDLLASLDDDGWAAPTRCEGWSVQDVVAHLTTANQLWTFSIGQGLEGEPSRFLVDFDPVATPAALVEAARSQSPARTFDEFVATGDALTEVLSQVNGDAWDLSAEAPPGHLPIRAVVLHALWDAWTHERDVALPLGLPVRLEPDEIAGSLVYAAALGPTFLALQGSTREGTLEVAATDPDVRFTIQLAPTVRVVSDPAPAGTPVLAGDAVALVEGLSFRAPMPVELPDDERWLLGSLGTVFDDPVVGT